MTVDLKGPSTTLFSATTAERRLSKPTTPTKKRKDTARKVTDVLEPIVNKDTQQNELPPWKAGDKEEEQPRKRWKESQNDSTSVTRDTPVVVRDPSSDLKQSIKALRGETMVDDNPRSCILDLLEAACDKNWMEGWKSWEAAIALGNDYISMTERRPFVDDDLFVRWQTVFHPTTSVYIIESENCEVRVLSAIKGEKEAIILFNEDGVPRPLLYATAPDEDCGRASSRSGIHCSIL